MKMSWIRGPSSNGTELLGKSTSPPTYQDRRRCGHLLESAALPK